MVIVEMLFALHFAKVGDLRRRSSMAEHLFCKQAVAGSNPIAGSTLALDGTGAAVTRADRRKFVLRR